MTEATARPWSECRNTTTNIVEGDGKRAIVTVSMRCLSSDKIKSRRALIVKAVNYHDALVEFLQQIVSPYEGFDDTQTQRRIENNELFRAVSRARFLLEQVKKV